ncbi:MAG: DUF1684 domain-containing protein [Bacteroidia bacterium]|nr:DUF1684 domain-containing protein [Bacteroidia bacterium]
MRIRILGSALFLIFFFGCKGEKRYHDEVSKTLSSSSEVVTEIQTFHEHLNEEFRDPERSPLPDRYKKNFLALDFYDPDTSFRVWAKFTRTPEAVPFFMPTTTTRVSTEVLYGLAEFKFDSIQVQLELYKNVAGEPDSAKKDLFLPFLDQTNGESTYSGGRYIDLPIPETDSILIDFNKAYNPYCVYNKKYSCPIVPTVNTIPIAIEAGVKDFIPTKKP